MKGKLGIIVIIVVAGLTRFVDLGDLSRGVHPDEAMYGYDGYSLAVTGTDHRQTGHPPFYLQGQSRVWDNRTSVLYPYILAGLMKVFPPTMFLERLPAALVGTLIVLLMYLLTRQLVPTLPAAAEVAAGLVAISPVALSWSRTGHDAIFLPAGALTILWLILRTRTHPSSWWWASALTAVCLYAYQPLKLVAPLMFLWATWYVWPTARRQWRLIARSLIPAVVIAVPIAVTQLTHWSAIQGEFTAVNILHNPHDWWKIWRNIRYIFGDSFLFSWEAVFPFLLPIGALGWWWLWRRQRRRGYFLLGWFVIGLLPAIITNIHANSVDLQWRSFGTLGSLEIGAAVMIPRWTKFLYHRLFTDVRWTFAAMLAVVLLATGVSLTWYNAVRNTVDCCTLYGGLDKALTFIDQPAWRQRPVIINLAGYTMPDTVLWLTRYPPRKFQSQPVVWEQYTYAELGLGELPARFGRFHFCLKTDCYQPADRALYVVPAAELTQLPEVYAFTLVKPKGRGARELWHIVQND